jgi:hypothetical protein
MANVGTLVTTALLQFLQSPGGLSQNLGDVGQLLGINLPDIDAKQVYTQNVAQALVERAIDLKYPTLLVYCDKFSNDLREKFRTFSGRAAMTIEVRVSHDRIEGLENLLQIYVDVVTRILDQNRGSWGNGLFYTGGYQAVFGQLERGGRNFFQTGKISFEVLASID